MFRLYFAPGTCALATHIAPEEGAPYERFWWISGRKAGGVPNTSRSTIEGDGVDTKKVSQIMKHRTRLLARPAVQKAVAAEGTQIP